MELDYHFVRERVATKTLQMSFVSNKDQIADILTKPLFAAKFFAIRSSLTIQPVTLESRGLRHMT